MAKYRVLRTSLRAVPGDFPETIREYIAIDSCEYHYTFTNDVERVYVFEDFEHEKALFTAKLWDMKCVEIKY